MSISETENILFRALSERMSDGAAAGELARSLARSISYDAGLQQLPASDLEAAVAQSAPSTEHHVIMERIRSLRGDAARAAGEERRKEDDRLVNIGFFLQCHDAFCRDGHLRSVRILTVTFLADWLVDEGKYIEPDETAWCRRKAAKDTLAVGAQSGGREEKDAFSEAVVLLVMEKFRRAMENNPDRTSGLIDGWRKEYGDYCQQKYGHRPGPVPTGFLRNRAVSALPIGA